MFYIIQGFGYFLFILMDSFNVFLTIPSSIIKYICIIFCLLYGIGWHFRYGSFRLQIIMLFFIVIADYYLLFTSDYKMGILFFCFVQCCYTKILNPKFDYISIFFPYLFLGFFIEVSILAIVYALHSGFNIFRASCVYYKTKKRRYKFILLAIVLLFLCDIHVALQYLHWFPTYQQWISQMIWIFYLPSVWCLVRSFTLSCVSYDNGLTKY